MQMLLNAVFHGVVHILSVLSFYCSRMNHQKRQIISVHHFIYVGYSCIELRCFLVGYLNLVLAINALFYNEIYEFIEANFLTIYGLGMPN